MGRESRVGEEWCDDAREAASALSNSSGSSGRGPIGGSVGAVAGCGGVQLTEKGWVTLVRVEGESGRPLFISASIASNAMVD